MADGNSVFCWMLGLVQDPGTVRRKLPVVQPPSPCVCSPEKFSGRPGRGPKGAMMTATQLRKGAMSNARGSGRRSNTTGSKKQQVDARGKETGSTNPFL